MRNRMSENDIGVDRKTMSKSGIWSNLLLTRDSGLSKPSSFPSRVVALRPPIADPNNRMLGPQRVGLGQVKALPMRWTVLC